jgi:hypothetical protein
MSRIDPDALARQEDRFARAFAPTTSRSPERSTIPPSCT